MLAERNDLFQWYSQGMPELTGSGRGSSLSGRRGQAARNDALILEAARDVFLEDPKAPIAAVAARAGVGISALYRRYASKEDLLRRLCHDGLRRFIAAAEASPAEPDDWQLSRVSWSAWSRPTCTR